MTPWWWPPGWGNKWGWRGPWPGKGPWSYLPPWQRPGWYLGRGWCWYYLLSQQGAWTPTPPPFPPAPIGIVRPEEELQALEEYKKELLEELKSIEERIEYLRKTLEKKD